MQLYIGTKQVLSKAMSRLQYNKLRGWALPADENGEDEGYLVEYTDGGAANHPNYAGYISWSPKAQFETAYQTTNAMSFGHAIVFAEQGYKIARQGWNGKNMFVALMPALSLPAFSCQEPGPKVNDRTAKFIGEDTPLDSQPYFAMYNAQGKWQPGWSASQADMLAKDWCIVS